MATKAELRKVIAGTLAGLTSEHKHRQSTSVIKKLLNHARYKEAKGVCLYLSTENEVDTLPILRHAFENDKQCFIPYVRRSSKTGGDLLSQGDEYETRMIMVELKSLQEYDSLTYNHYGIKEPTRRFVDTHKVAYPSMGYLLDLAIVPGVAFARDGRRLGHGKAYYDEFLTNWSERSEQRLYTIGLAFDEQLVADPLSVAGEDYKLDEVLACSLVGD